MKKLLFFSLITCGLNCIAQTPTYSEHIAPILFNSCTSCHHEGGLAPFSLMTYSEASSWGSEIVLSIIEGEMPPWPVDSTYQRYANERILNASEINTIVEWVNDSSPQGDPNLSPLTPVYTPGAILPNPDYTISLPAYTSNAVDEDEYICFSLETNFPIDKNIRAIEIIPGNPAIVHHALLFTDTALPSEEVTDDCMGVSGNLVAGYTPGSAPTIFPNGGEIKMGVPLEAGSNMVMQMHYPEGSAGTIDSTKVNFFFYPDDTENIREVYTESLLENWSLYIPANTVKTFNTQYPSGNNGLNSDYSILSVFPHMHLIGKEITSYAVKPNNDTIPFERVLNWDFEWQGFYNFKNMLKIPAGSTLKAHAVYDNTSANPHNPNTPPQLVTAGEATTDEMFLVFFQYLDYVEGDENLDLENLINMGRKESVKFIELSIFPNPTTEFIQLNLPFIEETNFKIFNLLGEIVLEEMVQSNEYISVKELPEGIYVCYVQNANNIYSTRIVKQ
jgi:hypothetical protein|tara:strand:- start:799 stop:2307 length:1509 start_codon:yes stop_codon:yes gene_type:complete